MGDVTTHFSEYARDFDKALELCHQGNRKEGIAAAKRNLTKAADMERGLILRNIVLIVDAETDDWHEAEEWRQFGERIYAETVTELAALTLGPKYDKAKVALDGHRATLDLLKFKLDTWDERMDSEIVQDGLRGFGEAVKAVKDVVVKDSTDRQGVEEDGVANTGTEKGSAEKGDAMREGDGTEGKKGE